MNRTVEEILEEAGWNADQIEDMMYKLYEGTATNDELDILERMGAIRRTE